MHNGNWDDLRYVLAVAETGSVSAAARELGVNHATVLRRISAFETDHGALIFDRGPRGYAVLPDQFALIEAAREVAAGFTALDRLIVGSRRQTGGLVRVTSTDTFTAHVLPPIVAAMRSDLPDLTVELLTSNSHADFGRLQADIAVRPAVALPDDLSGEIAAELGFAVYAARSGGADRWLGFAGPLERSKVSRWLEKHSDKVDSAATADSFVALASMAANGLGRTVLPQILGEHDARLGRVRRYSGLPPVPIWVASHADVADAKRLKTARSALASGLRAIADDLLGR